RLRPAPSRRCGCAPSGRATATCRCAGGRWRRSGPLLPVFGAVFELLLEGGELGKGGIRVGFLVLANAQARFGVITLALGALDTAVPAPSPASPLLALVSALAFV